MNVYKIPVDDLLAFIKEQPKAYKTIPDLIVAHYLILTGRDIYIQPDATMENWCNCDSGEFDDTFPAVSGLLVENKAKNYFGILEKNEQTNKMFVWTIDKGVVKKSEFFPAKWKRWGGMGVFYNYEKYNYYPLSSPIFLGCRDIGFDNNCPTSGKDVLLLQKILIPFYNIIIPTGTFDKITEEGLMVVQDKSFIIPTGRFRMSESNMLLRFMGGKIKY